ncbi:MAG: exosome protein [Candidatus Methanomethylicota archaeon]|uniref:Exosome protein n=1 Tax=Thermoproteota archaeon TaxID=2056631 RepID=A0A497EXH0_9CREN|nr:MAG: exosome protein [Candidatus Verstraetearchaeota archaeon]
MAEKAKVIHAYLESFAHATEDIAKVKEALLNLIPQPLRDKVQVLEEVVHGHHGNPITILRAMLTENLAQELVKHLSEKLDDLDKAIIKSQVDRFSNGAGNLYLKISKQQAYLGKVTLTEGDDIIKLRVTMTRLGKSKSALIDFLKSIGLIK